MESLIIMFVAGGVLGIVIANLPMFRPRYHKGEEAMTTDTPSDLVKRLRALFIMDEANSDNPLGQEAADRIEQLEAESRHYSEDWDTALGIAAKYLKRIEKAEIRLAEARKWYDDDYPAEEGHDQVYPWDHIAAAPAAPSIRQINDMLYPDGRPDDEAVAAPTDTPSDAARKP